MKKSVHFIFCLFALASFSLNAQNVLVSANFDDGEMPNGWTTATSGTEGWMVGDSDDLGSSQFQMADHGIFAGVNDQNCACDMSEVTMTSPSFTISGPAAMTFSHAFRNWDNGGANESGYVEISTNGTSWNLLHWVTTATSQWEEVVLQLDDYVGTTAQIRFRYFDGNGANAGWTVDDILVYELVGTDIAISPVNLDRYLTPGVYPITVTLTNNGAETINSVYIIWTGNLGIPHFEVLDGISIPPFGTYTHTAADPLIVNEDGYIDLTVIADSPNGVIDGNLLDNATSEQLVGMTRTPEKFVLIEEFSGAWCGFCPDGAVQLEAAIDNPLAEGHVLGYTIHNGDAMENASIENALVGAYVSGFPSGMVDRYLFDDLDEVVAPRGSWPARSNERTKPITPAGISMVNSYNATTKELTVTITGQFFAPVEGDYRLNVAIVEDHVTGTGVGYNQVNYYDGGGFGPHPYDSAGDPIIGFDHRHVLRHMFGGAWGAEGSVATSVAPGDEFTQTFTVTLDGTVGGTNAAMWDVSEITLIGMIHKHSDVVNERTIVNALSCTLNNQCATQVYEHPAVGIEETTDIHTMDIVLYPNPTEGMVNLNYTFEGTKSLEVKVLNPLGQVVFAEQTQAVSRYAKAIDLSQHAKGIYIISLNADGEQTYQKVVVQ